MPTSTNIEQLLGRVFDSANEGLREEIPPAEYEKQRHDFVFHMTDWREDLDQLADLFDKAGQYDEEAATTFIIGFLYHVAPHIKAAARLLQCEITRDPFAPVDDKLQR